MQEEPTLILSSLVKQSNIPSQSSTSLACMSATLHTHKHPQSNQTFACVCYIHAHSLPSPPYHMLAKLVQGPLQCISPR